MEVGHKNETKGFLDFFLNMSGGREGQWEGCTTRGMACQAWSLNAVKDWCFCGQETLPSLLSTVWFLEWVSVLLHVGTIELKLNRIKQAGLTDYYLVNIYWLYCILH